VLRDDKDLREISNAKYSYMRAEQLEQANKGISLMPSVDAPVMPTYDEALVLPPSFEEYLDKEKLLELEQGGETTPSEESVEEGDED
jgi:general secretion pathway protein D